MRRILYIGSDIGQGRFIALILARQEYAPFSFIGDVHTFIQRLRTQSDALCLHLWRSFSSSEQVALNRAPYFGDRPDIKMSHQRSVLCSALNRCIYGPSIYERARFESIKLSPESRHLMEKVTQDNESLPALNRSLLDDAFPLDLKRRRACTVTIEPNQENVEAAISKLRPHLILFDLKAPTVDALPIAQSLRNEGVIGSDAFVFISHLTEAFPELPSHWDGFPILYWPFSLDQLRNAFERVP